MAIDAAMSKRVKTGIDGAPQAHQGSLPSPKDPTGQRGMAIPTLRHDALATERTSVLVDERTVVLVMLVEETAPLCPKACAR